MSDDEDLPKYRSNFDSDPVTSDDDIIHPIRRARKTHAVGSRQWLDKLHDDLRSLERQPLPADADLESQIRTFHEINACITQRMTKLFEKKAQIEEARKKKIETAQKNLAEAETKLKESQKRKAEALAKEKEQEAEVKRLKKAYESEVKDGQPKVLPVTVSAPNATMKR